MSIVMLRLGAFRRFGIQPGVSAALKGLSLRLLEDRPCGLEVGGHTTMSEVGGALRFRFEAKKILDHICLKPQTSNLQQPKALPLTSNLKPRRGAH